MDFLSCFWSHHYLPQRAHPAERWHRLHPQAGWWQLVWRRASWESGYIPYNLCGGQLLHSVLFLCSYVSRCCVQMSSLCPWQILPPTEKPTPIKSPTLQVLDYGEAVALYNFNGDLPVELSFRKVSIAKELQHSGKDFLLPWKELFWIMCIYSTVKKILLATDVSTFRPGKMRLRSIPWLYTK